MIDEGRTKEHKNSFCLTDGHLSFEKCWIGDKAPKIQRSSCKPRVILWKTIQTLMQCSLNKARLRHKWWKQRSWISYPDCQGAQDKQRMQYLLIPKLNMKDTPQLLKIPKSECPDIWIRLPRHKWPKSWTSMEDPVVPLESNLYGQSLTGLLWERQF